MAKVKVMEARVLAPNALLGIVCGMYVQATPGDIMSLVKAGEADPHPDAVDYAKKAGEKLVRIGEVAKLGDDDVQLVSTSQEVLDTKSEGVDGPLVGGEGEGATGA